MVSQLLLTPNFLCNFTLFLSIFVQSATFNKNNSVALLNRKQRQIKKKRKGHPPSGPRDPAGHPAGWPGRPTRTTHAAEGISLPLGLVLVSPTYPPRSALSLSVLSAGAPSAPLPRPRPLPHHADASNGSTGLLHVGYKPRMELGVGASSVSTPPRLVSLLERRCPRRRLRPPRPSPSPLPPPYAPL